MSEHGVVEDTAPLTRTVLDYTEAMKRLVPAITAPTDWAPLAAFVAVDDSERVGVFREVQDWRQYTEMLTRWESGTDSFERQSGASPSCPASSTTKSRSGTTAAKPCMS